MVPCLIVEMSGERNSVGSPDTNHIHFTPEEYDVINTIRRKDFYQLSMYSSFIGLAVQLAIVLLGFIFCQ